MAGLSRPITLASIAALHNNEAVACSFEEIISPPFFSNKYLANVVFGFFRPSSNNSKFVLYASRINRRSSISSVSTYSTNCSNVYLCIACVLFFSCFSSVFSSLTSLSKRSSPFTTILTILVCESRIVTVASPFVVFTNASMKIRLVIPLNSTRTFPSSINLFAVSLSSGHTSAKASSPFLSFPAITPNAAAKTFPTSLLFGIPQVNAFLYIPLFSATRTCSTSPST